MPLVVLRVWMPDRPGALGLLASRIGSVRGDVVGIEIVERGAGRVVDELVVELPSDVSRDLLVREVSQVDDVAVEDVRATAAFPRDARLDALEVAGALMEPDGEAEVSLVLADHLCVSFEAQWSAVLDVEVPHIVAAVGDDVPTGAWLRVFSLGSRATDAVAAGPGALTEVVSVEFEEAPLVALLGRQGRPFRAGERRRLSALVRIADLRWREIRLRESWRAHPSARGFLGAGT